MRRILEETLTNGEKRYCVQSNTIFGIPTKFWRNVTMETSDDLPVGAVFDTLEEAKFYLGIGKAVESSRVVYIET